MFLEVLKNLSSEKQLKDWLPKALS